MLSLEPPRRLKPYLTLESSGRWTVMRRGSASSSSRDALSRRLYWRDLLCSSMRSIRVCTWAELGLIIFLFVVCGGKKQRGKKGQRAEENEQRNKKKKPNRRERASSFVTWMLKRLLVKLGRANRGLCVRMATVCVCVWSLCV